MVRVGHWRWRHDHWMWRTQLKSVSWRHTQKRTMIVLMGYLKQDLNFMQEIYTNTCTLYLEQTLVAYWSADILWLQGKLEAKRSWHNWTECRNPWQELGSKHSRVTSLNPAPESTHELVQPVKIFQFVHMVCLCFLFRHFLWLTLKLPEVVHENC